MVGVGGRWKGGVQVLKEESASIGSFLKVSLELLFLQYCIMKCCALQPLLRYLKISRNPLSYYQQGSTRQPMTGLVL